MGFLHGTFLRACFLSQLIPNFKILVYNRQWLMKSLGDKQRAKTHDKTSK